MERGVESPVLKSEGGEPQGMTQQWFKSMGVKKPEDLECPGRQSGDQCIATSASGRSRV